MLNFGVLGGLVGGEKAPTRSLNLLDTSVIIDGRIADIAETGFLAGGPEDWMRALERLRADRALAGALGQAGRALVAERYALAALAPGWAAALADVASAPSRSRK